MIDPTAVHPLTSFLRDHKSHIERLAETGRPEVLTVNGRATIVIQDAASYERQMDEAEEAEIDQIVRERIADIDRGARGIPLRQALREIREHLGIKTPGERRGKQKR